MAARRGNNEGSIYQAKDGRWVAALTVGYDKKGKQKRKVWYGKTRREVQEKLTEALNLQRQGQLTLKSLENITIKEWLNLWLEEYKQHSLKPRTFLSYQKIAEIYLVPELGKIRLKNLTTNQIQKAINSLASKVSSRTVEYAISILKQALKQAMVEGYIYNNPALNVSLPRKEQGNVTSLTLKEVEKVFSIIENPAHYIIYYTFLSTGIRRGELLALKWNEVDLSGQVFNIKWGITKDLDGKWGIDTPKTPESTRSFTIPDKLAVMLKKHQLEQKKQILKAGIAYNNQGLVFAKDDGNFYDPDYISRRWKMYCDKLAINSNLHELRHTFATFALQSGMDITTVSKILGHKDVTTTLNIYSHILPDSTKKVAKTINELLPKKDYSAEAE